MREDRALVRAVEEAIQGNTASLLAIANATVTPTAQRILAESAARIERETRERQEAHRKNVQELLDNFWG